MLAFLFLGCRKCRVPSPNLAALWDPGYPHTLLKPFQNLSIFQGSAMLRYLWKTLRVLIWGLCSQKQLFTCCVLGVKSVDFTNSILFFCRFFAVFSRFFLVLNFCLKNVKGHPANHWYCNVLRLPLLRVLYIKNLYIKSAIKVTFLVTYFSQTKKELSRNRIALVFNPVISNCNTAVYTWLLLPTIQKHDAPPLFADL